MESLIAREHECQKLLRVKNILLGSPYEFVLGSLIRVMKLDFNVNPIDGPAVTLKVERES